MKRYDDARDAVFQELYTLALQDSSVMLLTADTGAYIFKEFKKELPNQFFNVGIAEQNMISVAAGLTLSGKNVFVYGISNFVTLRCFEQIKIDVCCMERPVTIIGMGTGYVYSSDGPTHHITDDVVLMRSLPGMTILSPSDCSSCASAVHLAYKNTGPCYIRFDKGPFHHFYEPDADFSAGVAEVKTGKEYAIVATGIMVTHALKIADALMKRGLDVSIIDLYRIKPVNSRLLAQLLAKYKAVFTLEEHTTIGGIGSVVLEVLSANKTMVPVEMFGIPDRFRCDVGSRERLRHLDGLDVDTVATKIMKSV